MFLRLRAADQAVDLILQQSAEDGGDDGALALRADVGARRVRVGQQGEQLTVQPVEQVTHELVGVLLLVTPGNTAANQGWSYPWQHGSQSGVGGHNPWQHDSQSGAGVT